MNGREFQGVNAGYVEELYDRYRLDPSSVDDETRKAFESGWMPPVTRRAAAPADELAPAIAAVVGAVNLAECIRRYGHLAAQLDPLGASRLAIPPWRPKPTASPRTTCAACRPA